MIYRFLPFISGFVLLFGAVLLQAADYVARYSGMLPCADCSGIRIELTLDTAPARNQPGIYELKQTYEGTRDGEKTFTQRGTWTVSRGSDKNRRATVYELDGDKPDQRQYFLRANENTLRLLDRQKREIPPHVPQTLHRVR